MCRGWCTCCAEARPSRRSPPGVGARKLGRAQLARVHVEHAVAGVERVARDGGVLSTGASEAASHIEQQLLHVTLAPGALLNVDLQDVTAEILTLGAHGTSTP